MQDLEFYRSAKSLFEARQPHIKYTEVPTSKKDPTVKRVIAELEASTSATATKLLNRYMRMQWLEHAISQRRDALNAQVKQHMEDFFDASDVWITREMRTKQVFAVLAKTTPQGPDQEVTDTDWEAAAQELLKLLDKKLMPLGEAIIKKYTTTETIPAPKPKTPGLTFGILDKEKLGESREHHALAAWSSRFLDTVHAWAQDYDAALDQVMHQLHSV